MAVASKATSEVDIASSVLTTFPGDFPTDMAYVSQGLEVKSGATTANCVLKRSLTKFVLASSDPKPGCCKDRDYLYWKILQSF